MPRVAGPPDVRESVLDAATRLMEGSGFKKMTMEAIAHEAGIGKATIYGYFENKEDVALSVIRRHQTAIRRRWEELLESPEPADARLREMLVGLVLHSFDRAQRCRQSMDEALAAFRQVILHRRYEFQAELAQILAGLIVQGVQSGLFESRDPLATAQTLVTAVSGLNATNLSPQELGERSEIEERTNQVVDLMISGLGIRCAVRI